MTKAELEKEAIKASDKKCAKGCSKYYRYGFQDGYIIGAEPRGKRIAELEAQIEKMKCCRNCLYQGECDLSGYEECKNFDKWELRR